MKKNKDIYSACSEGDLEFVRTAIRSGQIDLTRKNDLGFTALHCAAMGSNETDPEVNLEIIKLLVEAGSELDALASGGRTALYLLAEFSPTLDAIKFLVDKGANPDVSDEMGNHITENAMMEETQEYLSSILNKKIGPKASAKPIPVKLKNNEWRKVQAELLKVFKKLNQIGFVAIENTGVTQSDGFNDCSEEFHRRKDKEAIVGFCFYTSQDRDRAKDFGLLPLAIWGSPNGGEAETIKAAQIAVGLFRENGFDIGWNETASTRPEVYLNRFVE